jgi:hypothetical protein
VTALAASRPTHHAAHTLPAAVELLLALVWLVCRVREDAVLELVADVVTRAFTVVGVMALFVLPMVTR